MSDNREFYEKVRTSKVTYIDLFSDVFKHHNKQDGERLFLSGTSSSARSISEMLSQWRKPWLFIWFLGFGLGLIFLLDILKMQGYMQVVNIPLFFIGSYIVPLSVVFLFFELNVPRNIPFYEIVIMILAGGILSLIFTAYFNTWVGPQPDYLAPLTEEPGKLLALCIFLRKPNKRYILNGVLIGGAIGAGFAAIETTGYGLKAVAEARDAMNTLIMRGVFSIGGHVLWAALYGGALAMVMGNEKLSVHHFFEKQFVMYFLSSCLLHFVWNSTIFCEFGKFKFATLIIAGWLLLLNIINSGLKQIVFSAGSSREIYGSSGSYGSHISGVKGTPYTAKEYRLYGISGVYEGKVIPITKSNIIMGRDPAFCNVLFPASTSGISRNHCTIALENNEVYLWDNGSSYGTFLAGGTKMQTGVKVHLKAGDQFYLGSGVTLFELQS